MSDPYQTDARFYDAIHGDRDDDTGLWLSYAGRTDRPVIEVGCGTGRIALELARHGHTVTGIDPSAAMLDIARLRAEADALEIELLEGRVLDLALPQGHFGLAILPADVLLYCEDLEEQVATFGALGRALQFNGLLAVDLPGPALWLDPATNGQPILVFSGEAADGTRFDAWQLHEDDLATQTRLLRVTYETVADDNIVRRWQTEHTLRYIYRFEIELLLNLAGLAMLDIYGDYDLGPLTNESERMIVIARSVQG